MIPDGEIDRLLMDAGDRWRRTQPPAPIITAATFTDGRGSPLATSSVVLGAAVLVLVIGLAAVAGWRNSAAGDGLVTDPQSGSAPTSNGNCAVTRPDGEFVPPEPHLETPPAYYGSDWYGSDELWTMLDRDGEVWSDLPRGPSGFTQKTFWWSAQFSAGAEPQPNIIVTGEQFDGTGRFESDSSTHAFADFGEAMLVGIEIPSPGCWEVTAEYGGHTLSYVVSVLDD